MLSVVKTTLPYQDERIRPARKKRSIYGALAQLVARYIRIVEVSGSNPLCSTIQKKSEPDPDWEWVRISLFPLKYRGVIDF